MKRRIGRSKFRPTVRRNRTNRLKAKLRSKQRRRLTRMARK